MVFYGWWIVGACFLVNVCVGGVVYFGFTALFEPIANEFGWSYALVSLASSLRGLEMGILSPVTGLLVDRYGPRKLVFGGAILLGTGLMLLSRINTLAMFYGAFALVAMGMSACIGAPLVTAIAHWFQRKMSTAMGIAACGVAVGGLFIPLITMFIDVYGWRVAIFSLGLGISVIILLLSLVLRHKPEPYGYLPDGEAVGNMVDRPEALARELTGEPQLRTKQFMGMRTFWYIALAYMGLFTVISAVIVHIMPYLSNLGIDRSMSSLLASAMPLVTIPGRLGFGWLGDRFNKKWLAVAAFGLMILGTLSFGLIANGGIWLALPFIVFFGVGYGGTAVMGPVLVGGYFGRQSFGVIMGFLMGISSVGQIVGPTLAGRIFDVWGSYQGIWFAFAVLGVVVTMVMAATPPVSGRQSVSR
ncbi:MFS transporter [Chloroflexota bacterium]